MKITNMVQGYSLSYIVYVTVELGVANILFQRTMDSRELGEAVHIELPLLKRLLRVLTAMDLLQEQNGYYGLTTVGQRLAKQHPQSLEAMVLFNGRICMKAWANFYKGLKRNVAPIELVEGESFFGDGTLANSRIDIFNDMMRLSSKQLNLEILERMHDVQKIQSIADIGGGAGDILIQLLQYFPNAQGIIFDQPYMKEEAEQTVMIHHMQDRCSFAEGSFFKEVPKAQDMYILSRVLHDWDEERARAIVRNVGQAMSEQSVLLVIERLLPKEMGQQQLAAYMGDMHIWTLCNGQERTEEEYQILFAQEGLYISRKHLLDSNEVILEVRKNERQETSRDGYEIYGTI